MINLIKLKIFIFLVLSSSILFADDGSKKTIFNSFSNSISNTFEKLTTFEAIKQAELEVESKDEDFKTDLRALIISSIKEDRAEGSYFLNQTSISTRGNDRETFNTGFIFRNLSDDKKWIRGINLFYDHEFPYVHQRYSAGLEIKSSVLELNSNFYQRISGDKTIGDTTERAMDGADIEFGIQLPYLPSSKLFFSAYEWQGNDYDVSEGKKVSLRIRPNSSLEIEIGADDNDRYTDVKTTGKITFIKKFGDAKNSKTINYKSDNMFEFQDMSNDIYDKVRRQNRIVKTVSGTVTIARGT